MPISEPLFQLLQQVERIDGNPYVFPSPKTGKPFASIYHSWNTARTKAGLSDVRMHDLRHSFASFLINNGRQLYEVQQILGHSQIKTTQRYAHLSNESLQNSANTAADSMPWLAEQFSDK